MTNPEIARILFMAQGTVKNHLTHIFGTLGIAGRVELAQEIVRRAGRVRGD